MPINTTPQSQTPKPIRRGWWNDSYVLKHLVNAAQALNAAYPNDMLISVGQSPAWVVYTAGLIRQATRQEAPNTKYIAFTGSFMSRRDDDNDAPRFHKDASNCYPTQPDINGYFNYLASQEVTPAQLCDTLQSTQSKAVFIDLICHGSGFASFIHLLLKAYEQATPTQQAILSQAVLFHVYQPAFLHYPKPDHYMVEGKDGHFTRIPLTVESGANANVFPSIAGLKGESDATEQGDRLVPCYDISRYGRKTLIHAPNDDIVAAIKSSIENAVYELVIRNAATKNTPPDHEKRVRTAPNPLRF